MYLQYLIFSKNFILHKAKSSINFQVKKKFFFSTYKFYYVSGLIEQFFLS